MGLMGFYQQPSKAGYDELHGCMNKLRNFILCSAAILCGWLTASYRYHPDADTTGKASSLADQTSAASTSDDRAKKIVPANNPQDRLATISPVKDQ